MLKIKKLYPDSQIPIRAYPTDSGLDLYAYLPDGAVSIQSLKNCVIPTGIAIQLPQVTTVVTEQSGEKYTLVKEAQIRGRSGLSAKGIHCYVGTIDNSYIGELKVILTNLGSSEPFVISHGMKIAQLVIQTVIIPELEIVEELVETDRSNNGFGSTGV
jgi:dUTP pyrophosphatase